MVFKWTIQFNRNRAIQVGTKPLKLSVLVFEAINKVTEQETKFALGLRKFPFQIS